MVGSGSNEEIKHGFNQADFLGACIWTFLASVRRTWETENEAWTVSLCPRSKDMDASGSDCGRKGQGAAGRAMDDTQPPHQGGRAQPETEAKRTMKGKEQKGEGKGTERRGKEGGEQRSHDFQGQWDLETRRDVHRSV